MTTSGDPFDPRKSSAPNPKSLRQNFGKSLMAPGDGTPWEDRGTLGLPAAYFKTVFSMLFAPAKTVDNIKRVDNRQDAFSFVIASAIPWFLTVWIHALLQYNAFEKSVVKAKGALNPVAYFVAAFVASVILSAGMVVVFNMGAKIYYGMVCGADMKGKGTPDLIYNVYAYSLSPSLLAVIPFAGPPIALIWGFILSVKTGVSRLRVKTGGAATAACFSLLAGVLLICGALALVWVFSHTILPIATYPDVY